MKKWIWSAMICVWFPSWLGVVEAAKKIKIVVLPIEVSKNLKDSQETLTEFLGHHVERSTSHRLLSTPLGFRNLTGSTEPSSYQGLVEKMREKPEQILAVRIGRLGKTSYILRVVVYHFQQGQWRELKKPLPLKRKGQEEQLDTWLGELWNSIFLPPPPSPEEVMAQQQAERQKASKQQRAKERQQQQEERQRASKQQNAKERQQQREERQKASKRRRSPLSADQGDLRALGRWKTVNKAGRRLSIVKLFLRGGKLVGKIIFLDRSDRDNVVCDRCSGDKRGEKVLGMEIVWDMEPKDNVTWGHGKILDPADGKEYGCSMWIDKDNPSRLLVRGWLGFFYRDQVWHRL